MSAAARPRGSTRDHVQSSGDLVLAEDERAMVRNHRRSAFPGVLSPGLISIAFPYFDSMCGEYLLQSWHIVVRLKNPMTI